MEQRSVGSSSRRLTSRQTLELLGEQGIRFLDREVVNEEQRRLYAAMNQGFKQLEETKGRIFGRRVQFEQLCARANRIVIVLIFCTLLGGAFAVAVGLAAVINPEVRSSLSRLLLVASIPAFTLILVFQAMRAGVALFQSFSARNERRAKQRLAQGEFPFTWKSLSPTNAAEFLQETNLPEEAQKLVAAVAHVVPHATFSLDITEPDLNRVRSLVRQPPKLSPMSVYLWVSIQCSDEERHIPLLSW